MFDCPPPPLYVQEYHINSPIYPYPDSIIEYMTISMMDGIQQKQMILAPQKGDPELVGSLTITSNEALCNLDSLLSSDIDSALFPSEVTHLLNLLQSIKRELYTPLNKIALIGDLYIFPEFRGHGYAQQFIQYVCQEIFTTTDVNYIILQPEPFEYVNNQQKSLGDTPDYEEKKESLVRLYQRNKFIPSNTNPFFMFQKRNTQMINNQNENMQFEIYSKEKVLPLLPILHQWCAKHLGGFPYYYAPPKEQLIHPFDTVYVNEEQALVVIGRENDQVIGLASGVSLGSFYLDYNVGYVFSPELMNQFKEKGYQPGEMLYMGYFLMAEDYKKNSKAVYGIFDQFIAAAKKWGKKQICYIQVLCDESRVDESPEPYGTIIKGFRPSGVMMPDHSWPTLQADGSFQMQSHDMTFYVMDIPI